MGNGHARYTLKRSLKGASEAQIVDSFLTLRVAYNKRLLDGLRCVDTICLVLLLEVVYVEPAAKHVESRYICVLRSRLTQSPARSWNNCARIVGLNEVSVLREHQLFLLYNRRVHAPRRTTLCSFYFGKYINQIATHTFQTDDVQASGFCHDATVFSEFAARRHTIR